MYVAKLGSLKMFLIFRYSADNDRRSSHYDDLLAAEDKAIKSAKGLHDKKNIPTRYLIKQFFLSPCFKIT